MVSLARLSCLLLGVFAVAGSLVGCTGGAEHKESPPAASLPPLPKGQPSLDPKIIALADPKRVTRPLGAYEFDAASAQVINRAREIVGDACMRQFGFAPVPDWTPEKIDETASWTRYGLWDPVAAETGYLPPGTFGDTAQPRYPVRFIGAGMGVYTGIVKEYDGRPIPEGGCAGEEFRAVMQFDGLPKVDGHFVSDLDREALTRSRQDGRVVSLLQAWRGCMKENGWDYADVLAPFDYWNKPPRRGTDKRLDPSDIGVDEKRSARDDLACKRSTGLLGTWLAADVAYQQAIIERDGEKLREYGQVLKMMLANANQIISEGGR